MGGKLHVPNLVQEFDPWVSRTGGHCPSVIRCRVAFSERARFAVLGDEMKRSVTYRGWEYGKKGDYHRKLDPDWSYTPTYLAKMRYVRQRIHEIGKYANILDAGCGEGVLVEVFLSKGYRITGIDLNYESDLVTKGSILNLPYPDDAFDMILLLDVFEHLAFQDQPTALQELRRVLRRGGKFVATIPNMAHWNSRFWFFVFGKLDRTDAEINHIGERPFQENLALLQKAGFVIQDIKGVTLTVPFLYRRIICRKPSRFLWLHDALQFFATPSLSMLNIFLCAKK